MLTISAHPSVTSGPSTSSTVEVLRDHRSMKFLELMEMSFLKKGCCAYVDQITAVTRNWNLVHLMAPTEDGRWRLKWTDCSTGQICGILPTITRMYKPMELFLQFPFGISCQGQGFIHSAIFHWGQEKILLWEPHTKFSRHWPEDVTLGVAIHRCIVFLPYYRQHHRWRRKQCRLTTRTVKTHTNNGEWYPSHYPSTVA